MKKIIYAGAYDSSNYDEAKSRYDKALVGRDRYNEFNLNKNREIRKNFNEMVDTITKPIKEFINDIFVSNGFSSDEFYCDVHKDWFFPRNSSDFEEGVKVYIKFKPNNKSFNFEYTVVLSDTTGNVIREASSWNGEDISKETSVEFLMGILSLVDELNRADWANILDIDLKDIHEFSKEEEKKYENEYSYNAEDLDESKVTDALVKDLMGTDNWLLCYRPVDTSNYDSPWYWAYSTVYIQFLSETSKRYRIAYKNSMNGKPEYVQISKDKISPIIENGDYKVITE